MRALITAGPTRERIDSVRFISNASSGRMGCALAAEAVKRGYDVCLVLGPVCVKPPAGAKVIDVSSAEEMTEGTLKELEGGYDVFVSAAAIADYTPEKPRIGKIKSGREMTLKLKPTRKLTKLVCEGFPGVFKVGFKAEYGVGEAGLLEAAKRKLGEGLNLVVANDVRVSRFGSEETEVTVLDGGGVVCKAGGLKSGVAARIWDVIEAKLALTS